MAKSRVTLCDVGPRDGLQNEPDTLEPAVRAELVGLARAARASRRSASCAPTASRRWPGPRRWSRASRAATAADTIGLATPSQVKRLVERAGELGKQPLGAHLQQESTSQR